MVLIRSSKPNSRGEFYWLTNCDYQNERFGFSKERSEALLFDIKSAAETLEYNFIMDDYTIINATDEEVDRSKLCQV